MAFATVWTHFSKLYSDWSMLFKKLRNDANFVRCLTDLFLPSFGLVKGTRRTGENSTSGRTSNPGNVRSTRWVRYCWNHHGDVHSVHWDLNQVICFQGLLDRFLLIWFTSQSRHTVSPNASKLNLPRNAGDYDEWVRECQQLTQFRFFGFRIEIFRLGF